MPILEVELVVADGSGAPHAGLAQSLADAAGPALNAAPGHTWLRLRTLPASQYAESRTPVPVDALPVFVSLRLAQPPEGAALDAIVLALTQALAAALGRSADRVHVEIAPAAVGRQAFGGRVIR